MANGDGLPFCARATRGELKLLRMADTSTTSSRNGTLRNVERTPSRRAVS